MKILKSTLVIVPHMIQFYIVIKNKNNVFKTKKLPIVHLVTGYY